MSSIRTIGYALLLLLCGSTAAWFLWPKQSPHADAVVRSRAEPADLPASVRLPTAKQAAAGLVVKPLEVRELQPHRWVPARVTYDETRHLEVIAPANGVIRSMSVRPGDAVTAGQVVAVVDCPEIGERRADVFQWEATLRLALREQEKARSVRQSLQNLMTHFDEQADLESVHEAFSRLPFGEFREPVFGALSRLRMADLVLTKLRPLADQGIATGRSFIEQQSAREVALAAYRAARENADFLSEQQVLKAESAAADASRRLSIARERLTSLAGAVQPDSTSAVAMEPLSHWSVRAPISGTVEELKLAVGERLPQGQGLLVIANTRQLWVEAELRERDWATLRVSSGDKVQVECPSVPHRQWSAQVQFVGRTQQAGTRAVPIVVSLDNADGLLRPGMFARVAISEGSPQRVLAVPASAVQEHNRENFVFVECGPGEFERRNVTTGIAADDWLAIEKGPAEGERVVVQGGFFLKSELLLEPED